MSWLVKIMKTGRAVTATAMVVAMSGAASAQIFTGNGDGNSFEDPENYGLLPTDSIPSVVEINSPVTVIRDVDISIDITRVNGGGVLFVTSGNHLDGLTGRNTRNLIGTSGDGTVNQLGGNYEIGHQLLIGDGAGNTGQYNLSGGFLNISRQGVSNLGSEARSSLELGTRGDETTAALFKVSGSSRLTTRSGVTVGAEGIFEVVGSRISEIGIGSNGTLDGGWIQQTGSVLRAGIDEAGITPIFIDAIDGLGVGGGNVTFDAGSILDPYDLGGAPIDDWTTVITWDGELFDSGLALSSTASAAGWEKRVEGNSLQVRLSAVPEPTSWAVLALSGIFLIGHRVRYTNRISPR